MIEPFLQWRNNGRPAGNGWNSPVNNAKWGTDYLNRTATAKSNIYENRPEETKYIYTDDDSQGKQLNGQNIYAVTFPKGQLPPVKGFWSLTLYNDRAFIQRKPAQALFARHQEQELSNTTPTVRSRSMRVRSRPGKDKENNWLPAPNGTFSLYIRAYWPEKAILDGNWKPPSDRRNGWRGPSPRDRKAKRK